MRVSARQALLSLVSTLAVACGGSAALPPDNARLISIEEERSAAERGSLPEVVTTLSRIEVDRTVDAGLGRFLQQVRVEPIVKEGRFDGFRIVDILSPEWAGVDLRVGDVVKRVNGSPIERPEQAHEVFSNLKSADALHVEFERAGAPAELHLPIVDAMAR